MTMIFKRGLLLAVAIAPITHLAGVANAAAIKYWDTTTGVAGAGAVPSGQWDTNSTANWNLDPDGNGTNTVWTAGDTAVFAAGVDAANAAYNVTIPNGTTQTAAGLTIDEGIITFLPVGPVTNTAIAVGTGTITVNSGATLAQNSLITTSATGSVIVNGGTIKNTATTTAGTFFSGNAAMKIGTGGAKFDYSGTNLLSIYTGVISDATGVTGQSLTKTGPGVLAFTTATSTYTGPTIISEGELRVRTVSNVLPVTTALQIASGAVFNINVSTLGQQVGSLEGAGNVGTSGGTLTVSGAASTIFSGAIKNQANAGASGGASANGKLVKAGAGILTLSGANDINGSVTISSATGVGGIIVSSGGALCGPVADVTLTSGILTLNNAAQTVENFSGVGGTLTLGTGHVLTINPIASQSFGGKITGAGGLTRINANATLRTLTLTGANDFAGATTLTAGGLTLGSTTGQALGLTASIALNASNAIINLTQSNQINNSAPMSFNGGTFNSGGLSEGSFDGLTGAGVAGIGAASLLADSIIDMGLASSTVAFADSALATWTPGKVLKIYNWTGAPTLGGGTDRLFFGSTLGGLTTDQLAQIQFFQGIGVNPLSGAIQLPTGEVVAVPEPTTFAALGLGAAFFARRRKA